MNSVNIIGRLTKDPVVSNVGSKNTLMARYTLAVDRDQENSDFINCLCFSKIAEFAEKYLEKGMKIGVHGRLQSGSYKNRDGQTVYTTDVLVSEHTFCEPKADQSRQQSRPQPQRSTQQQDAGGFMSIPQGVEDELPFK